MIRSRETQGEALWAAIQYLDPDLEDKRSQSAVIFAVLFIALLIGTIFILLKLRGL